jgi:hypothetical protein
VGSSIAVRPALAVVGELAGVSFLDVAALSREQMVLPDRKFSPKSAKSAGHSADPDLDSMFAQAV